jgi:hypothetical protein
VIFLDLELSKLVIETCHRTLKRPLLAFFFLMTSTATTRSLETEFFTHVVCTLYVLCKQLEQFLLAVTTF